MTAARLTKHQKETLLTLTRWAGSTGRWVAERDCGSRSALAHLFEKGYAERKIEIGPRGGEHVYYRPTGFGIAVRDRHVKVAAQQATSEIDTRLIEARKHGEVVLVHVAGTYYRGVPGEVERIEDKGTNAVVLNIGQRQIPLAKITKVEAA